MKVQLPQGTGSIKNTRPYKTLTPNQKLVYDLCYDEVNGPLFFAENCCYVNRNGLEKYMPYDYQREMIFNMHNFKRLCCLWGRQQGKCFCSNEFITIRSKKTGEIEHLTVEEFYKRFKK